MRIYIFMGLVFLSINQSKAQSLNDDFNGSSVNTNLWNVILPENDSSVAETGGYVSLENAGRLVTQTGVSTSYDISGSFLMAANPFSNFKVMLRTDGLSDPNYPHTTVNGIEVQFNIEDDNGDLLNNIKIYNAMPGLGVELGVASANLTLNNWNTFSIADDGENISVYFDGSSAPALQVQSSYSAGDKVAFLNREGGDAGSSISANGITKLDYINIVSAPEPSSLALIGIGVLGLACHRRLKR